MDHKALTEKFGHFVGKAVDVSVETDTFEIDGETVSYDIITVNKNHPVIQAFQRAAQKEGMTLIVWNPGSMSGTAPDATGPLPVKNSINAYVRQDENGTWRITDTLRIG